MGKFKIILITAMIAVLCIPAFSRAGNRDFLSAGYWDSKKAVTYDLENPPCRNYHYYDDVKVCPHCGFKNDVKSRKLKKHKVEYQPGFSYFRSGNKYYGMDTGLVQVDKTPLKTGPHRRSKHIEKLLFNTELLIMKHRSQNGYIRVQSMKSMKCGWVWLEDIDCNFFHNHINGSRY